MSTGLPGTSAASCSGLPVVTLSSNVLKASKETKSTSTHFCTFAVPTLECLPKQACPATALQDLSDLSGQLQFLASLLSQHQHGSWKPIRQEKRIQFPTGDWRVREIEGVPAAQLVGRRSWRCGQTAGGGSILRWSTGKPQVVTRRKATGAGQKKMKSQRNRKGLQFPWRFATTSKWMAIPEKGNFSCQPHSRKLPPKRMLKERFLLHLQQSLN